MLRAPVFDERLRVRLASHGAALCLAALVGVLAMQRLPLAPPLSVGLGAPSVSVAYVEIAPSYSGPREQPRHPGRQVVALPPPPTVAGSEAGNGMRLWLDGAAGRVVFEDGEHYLRCLRAALDRVDALGCPSLNETQVATADTF